MENRKSKTKGIDAVKIPIKFLHDQKLRSLSYFAGESLALTLGRVVLLGMFITEKRVNEFSIAEIDRLVDWKAAFPFARYLEMVGWAKVRDITCLVNMPRDVQPWHWRRFTGSIRCLNAKRDERGRLAANDTNEKKERVISRRHVEYDGEGNMIVERHFKNGSKKIAFSKLAK